MAISADTPRPLGRKVADSECPIYFYICGQCFWWKYGGCRYEIRRNFLKK